MLFVPSLDDAATVSVGGPMTLNSAKLRDEGGDEDKSGFHRGVTAPSFRHHFQTTVTRCLFVSEKYLDRRRRIFPFGDSLQRTGSVGRSFNNPLKCSGMTREVEGRPLYAFEHGEVIRVKVLPQKPSITPERCPLGKRNISTAIVRFTRSGGALDRSKEAPG